MKSSGGYSSPGRPPTCTPGTSFEPSGSAPTISARRLRTSLLTASTRERSAASDGVGLPTLTSGTGLDRPLVPARELVPASADPPDEQPAANAPVSIPTASSPTPRMRIRRRPRPPGFIRFPTRRTSVGWGLLARSTRLHPRRLALHLREVRRVGRVAEPAVAFVTI